MAPSPDISVLIVNWNTRDLADQAIASILRHEDPALCEIILADNASSDGSAAHLASKYPEARVMAFDSNLGFAKANNLAAREARGRHLLLFNSDAFLVRPILSECLALARREGPCLLGCRLLNGDGTVQVSASDFPTLGGYLAEAFGSTRHAAAKALARQSSWSATTNRVDWLTGAFILVEKEAYLRLGGFDETIFMYGEDMELCHRAARAGIPTVYAPEPEAVHLGGGSARHRSLRSVAHTDCGRIRTMKIMRGAASAFLLRLIFIFRSMTRVLLFTGPALAGRAGMRSHVAIHFRELLILCGLADADRLD